MPFLPGYKLLNCLHKGSLSNIYRAVRLSDNYPVVIKLSTKKTVTEKKAQRFRREFEIGQQIASPHVVRYLELKQDSAYGIALVLEDDNAVELTSVIPSPGFSVREFLAIAIQIVEGLQAIHAANIIHNDFKPSNILIQPTTKTIKIIDFNRSSTLRQKMQAAIPLAVGTLAYISPEQTGRINRSVDYHTDFYSLGVTFYRLLCGQLPFTADDALGLIHQHLAKQPTPPHDCKPTVALPLSQMVMKLLEKEAENRYQSCEGILHDLTYCLSTLNETGIIPEFEVGLQDFSNKLILSQHLYGREREIKTLAQAFERVSQGRREVLMVAGSPGIGKSMLIHEIQQPITLKNGFFLRGKFDQLNKNVAYSALTQAFDGLIKYLLAEDEASIAQWKTRLLTALGVHAQLVIKVVPTLVLLIGEQPTAVVADITQAKNVFNLVFQAFIHVFADAVHPLVIFLDDLQWADTATLELMVYLMQQLESSHLLWIGAYRDTEVTALHPAMQAIAALQEAEVNVQTLTLAPLPLESLQQWLADSLRMPLADVSSLAELIQQKTAGNPFFVKMFLQSLYDQRLLTFSQQTHWQWDMDKIRQHPATENVVALMTYQIQQLPAATQKALSVASCLGHRFSLSLLQIAVANTKDTVCAAIQPALNSGILIQLDGEVHFAHDRVQEAAYGLLAEAEKAHTHLTIGKRLLAHSAAEETLLFDIVVQFNHCRSLVTEPQERLQIVRLNLRASQKAKQATAYAAALNYLRVMEDWINSETLWQTDYALAFTFNKELAEMEYLCGHMQISQGLIAEMQPYLQSTLDKIDIYHLLMTQKTIQGHYQEVIIFGHQALQLLGTELPLDNPTAFIQREMPLLKQKLADIPFSALLNLPLVENPEKKATFKIFSALFSAAFVAGTTELYAVITLISINLLLTYGHAPESCHSYVAYGYLLCTRFQEYALGYQFGNLAIQLAEKLQSPAQYCQSWFVFLCFIYPWSKSLQQRPALLTHTYEKCLACGDLEYAGYCGNEKVLALFYQGMPLAKVQQEALLLLQFLQNTKHQMVVNTVQAVLMLLANLRGDTPDEWKFSIDTIDEVKFEKHCRQVNSFYALCHHHIHKAQAFYLYGYFEQVLDQLALAKKYVTFINGQYATANFNWHDSLTRLALYLTASEEGQQACLEQVNQNQQQMEKWQASCPENFAHKYRLVAAELARINRDFGQAEVFYEQAIELAGRHGFIQEQALAAELAARYWLERGRSVGAQGYLNIAFNGYKHWGAKRKLLLLKAQYPDLLQALAPPDLSQLVVNQETTLSGNTLKFLDLSSILKASQTISSEIELSKLLRSMMQIIIENAGAQQGAMLLVEADETLFVQAEYAGDGTITTLQKIPLKNWTHGAHAVIQYVKRLHQSLVVDNAMTHEQFKADPYISSTQAKSILCIPLLKHSELKAVLYVENNLMSYAFTPERVQTVHILTAQMAISLENACYFAEQLALTRQLTEQTIRIQLAEESLRAVTHDLELALQASKAGTWNWQIGTDSITWDAGNYAVFGLKPEEFGGTYEAVMKCVHPKDRERLAQDVKRCIEQDIPHDMEYRVIWPNGSQHVISAHGRVYRDRQGQPIKMAGVCLDITHRRQLEQERLQALQQAKEEERKRAQEAITHKEKLEEITDTMCHELRNPLNGLYGNVVLLREAINELKLLCDKASLQFNETAVTTINNFLAKAEEQLEAADICAKQLKEIVDDVLDYSKLEHNKVKLTEVPFDLANIVSAVTKMFALQIKQKELDLKLLLPTPPILLKGDPQHLKNILINLLTNAIKFTPKGSIKITAETKPLSSTETQLWVAVEDTGIGIAEAEQSQIFERFSQASRWTGAEYGGSGLGLAISKHIVEKMGGRIWVESQLGQGSKFSFTIKCKNLSNEEKAKWQAEAKQEQESLIVEGAGGEVSADNAAKTILVVEDNSLNQKITINYLKKAGYLYQVANNGLEALEQFKGSSFDAILMDIEMPMMGGIEATQKIREQERMLGHVTVPIIGLSGNAREEHKRKALQAGMNDYLTKPYHQDEIYAALKKHIIFKQVAGTLELVSAMQSEASKEALTASTIEVGSLRKRKIKHERKRFNVNFEIANQIVKNAIDTTLGRWRTYGCAFVPEDEQQHAVQLITTVFDDRRIQQEEYQSLEQIVSAAIYRQNAWYVCLNKIYCIARDEQAFIEQLKTIHDLSSPTLCNHYEREFQS